MKKMQKVHWATVVSCRFEGDGSEAIHVRARLDEPELFQPLAGQFLALLPASETSYMPRPFTIVRKEGNEISLLIQVVGENTRRYSQFQLGDRIEILGPYGKEVFFAKGTKKGLFVGGGAGGAALIPLVEKALSEGKDVEVFLGGRQVKHLTGISFLSRLGVKLQTITEDGAGKDRFVTALLEEALKTDGGQAEVIACGPEGMLEKVAQLCRKYGNVCQVGVEGIMACGMGACKGCAIFGGKEGKEVLHVCEDGPFFDASWIDWSALVKKAVAQASRDNPASVDTTCKLGPLVLATPILNCSGTLDLNACLDGSMDLTGLGAFVIKGLSLKERSGNPSPRVCETPSGMLNAIGLEYIGLERFLLEVLLLLLQLGIPIVANINGQTVEEYAELAQRLDQTGIVAIEINISCPNVKKGGMLFGKDPAMAARVVAAVRSVTSLPIITKLTPNVGNIGDLVRAIEDAGTDIFSAINTVEGAAINIWTRRPKIANVFAGLSGPAVQPIAVAKIMQIARATKLPIIGMGGNKNGYTGAELMKGGAWAVAYGTSGFANRRIYPESLEQLIEVTRFHGFTAISQLVGSWIR